MLGLQDEAAEHLVAADSSPDSGQHKHRAVRDFNVPQAPDGSAQPHSTTAGSSTDVQQQELAEAEELLARMASASIPGSQGTPPLVLGQAGVLPGLSSALGPVPRPAPLPSPLAPASLEAARSAAGEREARDLEHEHTMCTPCTGQQWRTWMLPGSLQLSVQHVTGAHPCARMYDAQQSNLSVSLLDPVRSLPALRVTICRCTGAVQC
jgi:hypothetical protein